MRYASVTAYLKAEDFNVIVLDWAYGASYNYFSARNHAATAGTHLGTFLTFLANNPKIKLDFKRTYLIGHSLGAHVMGFAGKAVKSQNKGQKIGHIVGENK